MPIEIRELHIKVSVTQSDNSAASSGNKPAENSQAAPREDLIAECVEQIMKILESKKER